jgi:uncharacterized membrane protein YjfL (UPF0719 family)
MLSGCLVLIPLAVGAESETASASPNWHARSPGEALLYMALFAGVGTGLAILGYKMFDYFTPGEVHKEIIEHRNVSAALVGSAVIIGTCIIIAASMIS